ncbi:PAS domain S-box protein [Rubrobacter tropicus]|uniref:histidine kinase n=1 Tax=Rubrobacter tropicus TaxID=2653851 RepID=A0A6G8QDB6_9ACTN|nr:PAS domain S-box protein [Rubrobacter tropicus]QIN84391.1 PAS domain S-box protein [Rubrobacter tropicus]
MTAPGEQIFSYRSFFDHASDGMLVVSVDGEVVDANSRVCGMLGYTREELLESGLGTVTDAADSRWKDVLAGRVAEDGCELGFVRRDGGAFKARVTFAGGKPDRYGEIGLILRASARGGSGAEPQEAAASIGKVLVESGVGLVALHEADNTISHISPHVQQVLGYGRDELVGIPVLDLVHPEDRALAALEVQKVAGDLARRSPPLRFRHKDGSWVHLENAATDSPHAPVSGGDVARHEPEEEVLRQSERHYRGLVGKAAGALALMEPDGTLKYASPATEEILGHASGASIGRNALDGVHPEDRDRIREALKAASKQGVAEESFVEIRIRHSEGSWRRFGATIANTPKGSSALVVDLKDLTEQREAEEALRQSEGRYRALVEQTKEWVYLADARTMRILESNAALRHALGYTAEELKRLTIYDLVAHDPDSVEENRRRVLQEKRSHIGERQYRRKDGTLADVEVYTEIVTRGGADVLCVVVNDVTGRKRTEENLRRSLGVLLALREAGQILGSTLEAEEIVTRLLTIMRGVSGLTAAVISVEDELGQPRIWREVGLEGLWRRARYAPQAEEARRAVLDADEHQLFRLRGPQGSGQLVGLCLPLRMKERIAGVLEAYGPESLASEDAVEILRSLAAQAASALENARLYGELAERERRLADLIGQLFTAQEEERRRVAYEVHDGLAQVAAAAHQHLQGFARFHPPGSEEGQALLSQALDLVQSTVGEARRVIANLRPTALDDFGLGTALRIEADRLRAEGYQVDYESNLDEDERLPMAVETALFRVAQEALTNVRRHARSRRVRVTLDRLEDRARMGVRDWGRGFDPSVPRIGGGPGERIGLNSMQERMALLGGSFLVRSRHGDGTLVTVEVPLPTEGADDGEGAPVEAEGVGLLAAEQEDL